MYANNSYNQEVFTSVFWDIKAFLFHYASYRSLHSRFEQLQGDKEFWTYTCDAHLQMATIRWCNVFGTRSGENHWHKLYANDKPLLNKQRDSFIAALLASGISESEYKLYNESMRGFRNKYVAHNTMNYNQPVPIFDKALETVFVFDQWVRIQIDPDVFEEISMRELFNITITSIGKSLDPFVGKVVKRKTCPILAALTYLKNLIAKQ